MQRSLGAFGRGLRRVAWGCVDALLPPQCPLCRAPVDGPHRLCATCFGRLNFITAPFCQRCGLAFATLGEAGPQGQCLGCLHREPRFARARAALVYDEAAQPLILPFKHADRTELAPLLAAMMARTGQLLLAEADAIIPVPLHRRRLIARRYNQAALLAAWLARQSRRPWLPDTLTRPRAGPGGVGRLCDQARSPPRDPGQAPVAHRRCHDLGRDGLRLRRRGAPGRGGQRRCARRCAGSTPATPIVTAADCCKLALRFREGADLSVLPRMAKPLVAICGGSDLAQP
jgi:predicted amidophosphoribosyltransferase